MAVILVFVSTKGFHLTPLRAAQFRKTTISQREIGALRVEINTDHHGKHIIHPQSAVKMIFIIPPSITDHSNLK